MIYINKNHKVRIDNQKVEGLQTCPRCLQISKKRADRRKDSFNNYKKLSFVILQGIF